MSNNKNFDSDFCGSLPLNHINVIQSYGYLIVLNKETLDIIQVSENITELFDTDVRAIVGRPLSDLAETKAIEDLILQTNGKSQQKIPATITVNSKKFPVLFHINEYYLILEVEQWSSNVDRTFVNVFEDLRYAITAIEQGDSIEEVCNIAISELRKITGFDGIMMYRFNEEWNGTVIAEEKVEELEHYLGHTFPASDVPKQARELYLKNPYRLIPDRDHVPVKLYPVINPATHSFIDLSDCNLRGVAAVHIEYLKNMNVQASMSIRVIHRGQLWGLIACHHLTPLYLNFELCAICELLSSVISNKITSILYKETFELEAQLQQKQTALVAKVYEKNDLVEGLFAPNGQSIGELFNATGTIAILNNNRYATGDVPDDDLVDNLVLWLQSRPVTEVFTTDHLPELYEDAVTIADIASGLLVFPIDIEKGEVIMCFRPEVIKNINWGGDPNQAINFEQNGKNYHPRNSFKLWQQQVKHTSLPWSDQELRVASFLRGFIYEFKTKQALS